MSTFGPFYPDLLQAAVNHAERLAAAVEASLDDVLNSPAFDPEQPTNAEVWLRGRSEEIEAFVRDVVSDWRIGSLSLEIAAAVLERYIETVHRGMLSNVTEGKSLACCGIADACITREAHYDTSTREPATSSDTDTPTPNAC